MASLNIIVPGVKPGTKRELPATGDLTLGRAEDNTIVLPGVEVSRAHALVRRQGSAYVVVDRGSRTGTRVNARALTEPHLLRNGDRIEIGACVLVYVAEVQVPVVEPTEIERDAASGRLDVLYSDAMMAMKRRIHEQVLQKLNLAEIAARQIQNEEMRARLEVALDQVLKEVQHELSNDLPFRDFRTALLDELVGYGPITDYLMRDDTVSEVMVNGALRVFVERDGKLYETGARFFNDRHLLTIIQRIVEPLGRHVDEASPMVDARLPNGSRVNAIIGPLALDGPALTVRKFGSKRLVIEDLIGFGSMTPDMGEFLREAVRARQNILISGGTGSGKTTLLNVLSLFIGRTERVVTIEDSAELKLDHRNLVRLEARPSNIEGRGQVSIRALVGNALRMRPDRIIVGECRGPEALDMLQAMNTGHDGSLTTVHANSPRDALSRLETLVLMAGLDLPSTAIRDQIASAVDLVIQQNRMADGTRKVVQISEITGREGAVILMQDIFTFKQEGFSEKGQLLGRFLPTGNIPRFVEDLKAKGDLRLEMGVFVPKA